MEDIKDSMEDQTPVNEICPVCGGSGWAPAEDAGTVRRCDCWKSRRLVRLLAASNIPKRYGECSFEAYLPGNTSQRKAKILVEGFLRDYPLLADDNPQKSVGLLFLGRCGVGKTHLAVALLRQLISTTGETGLFCNFSDLLREIQGSWNPVSQTSELDVLRPVMDAKVL
ncbi:MAG: ATP-binding protein, partial [Acidobacteriota bacterium]|nr:ATP-binding protein [Acidobacteriota bacterium]